MQDTIYYDVDSKMICHDISAYLLKLFGKNPPIIVCLGSDKVLSDMVGIFVADILKKRQISTYIFGGRDRNIDKVMAETLSKKLNHKNMLFVDSGLFKNSNSIAVLPFTKLNNGLKICSPSIVCGTIKLKNGILTLADTRFQDILKFSNIVADAITDYFSYVSLISGEFCS